METNRRDFLKTTAVVGLGSMMLPAGAEELSALAGPKKFEVPALGYGFDALEPYIDAQTMQIHHDKHHQAYVNKLNELLVEVPTLNDKPIDAALKNILQFPGAMQASLRNNGGGHWNHSFFWQLLKKDTKPHGSLSEAITRDFGSMENFTAAFEKAALGQFGSGWAWLISNDGKLSIASTANQDNPVMKVPDSLVRGTPVIGLDVWEHAYYLKYQNKRADYAKAFWNVLNWDQAEKNYAGR